MIQGSIVALVTPMDESGSIDQVSLKNLVEFHIEQGTDSIVAVGTTGESATLNEEEHCEVIAAIVGYAAGRIPILAGTGANSTSEALELTRRAKAAGADACLLVTPYYNKPTQEGLYLHHKLIAEAVDIPQILYNVPGRTAVDMLPETIARLSEIENIVGVKEATGKLERYRQIRDLCGDDFALYSGDDATSCDFCLLGGNGTITVTGNVAPRLVHEMIHAAIDGDRETALAIDAKLTGLHRHLFIQSNPIPVKWALAEMGLIKQGIRLPLTWLTEECFDTVRAAMRQAEVIE
ncbi:MAG: 4-hydroxy-tetrahydrodipicolinate synthase [Methylicorpusculum sp.]|uniref:4-hydroxy-tetrahydrodipicolinate synthase n=1 Tax=Methylicorpusculum sp. TaxID=2713644 RepID=UPI0027215058|nr:4-hydroxy-tetrahydrodipicolinate synthase [Methylicorpusculum sp.]MDO8846444.1 4-hydroxy-tetrahydrodipicolinate synthase [Methylicorpusculum sp.]MDO8941206.1 4-hydroxy-tetrahydrodipicolinate synthase [Methylicorpusculum sp.]MDP2179649.1 4-hydroxy-tetrahydrodipicolinate synthase [Methylicorpusculum sp.]MDP2202639.1 4-hydroxy-tetrahydrodipicolinate synthase [Methylicorpusculum sp.]MDP3528924.1 4-hydroxy-tetrahydrodipicolinate synthase [Methylicorpusculum sp.]